MRNLLAGFGLCVLVFGVATFPAPGQKRSEKKDPHAAFTDAKEAGADFAVQGEYVGEIDKEGKTGAQVVALGEGKFRVKFLLGGLPGAGWDGKNVRYADAATGTDGKTTITGGKDKITGTIDAGVLTAATATGSGTLKQVIRKSPTEGAKPPEGALVLFDGTKADEWEGGKVVEGNLLNNGITTKRKFKDYKAHVEFRLPFMPYGRGQGRGNSGFYFLAGLYELQILDSFGLKGENNECGGLYSIRAPAVNMCFPPLSWQTYDVDYKPARFDAAGTMTAKPVVTVVHNGVTIHDKVEIPYCTEDHNRKITTNAGPIHLQNHGNPVYFRNIWLVETNKD